MQFAMEHGFQLQHEPRLSRSSRLLFSERAGAFLARLELEVPDGSVDYHYVAYDASTGRVLDNERRGKVPVVRNCNRAACGVFAALFPNAVRITLNSVLRATF